MESWPLRKDEMHHIIIVHLNRDPMVRNTPRFFFYFVRIFLTLLILRKNGRLFHKLHEDGARQHRNSRKWHVFAEKGQQSKWSLTVCILEDCTDNQQLQETDMLRHLRVSFCVKTEKTEI